MNRRSSHSRSQPDRIRRSLYKTWREIENVEEQINATKEKIERANTRLEKLQRLKEKLHQTAKTEAQSLSPFKKLSRDIIGEIVGHIIYPEIVVRGGSDTIWTLTHVCSTWRGAILSLPHLWSSFVVERWGDKRLDMILAILERSGSCPLSFSISLTDNYRFDHNAAIVSLLIQHSERWKSVRLETSVGPSVLLPLHKRMPLLESLTIRLKQPNETDPWHNSDAEQRIFEDVPKLKKLEFGYSCPIRFKFPTIQLHTFCASVDLESVSQLSGHWRFDELPLFQSLSNLNLRGSRFIFSNGLARDQPRVRLPTVTHFRLEGGLDSLAVFLFPSMTTLELCDVAVNENSLVWCKAFLDTLSTAQLNTFSLELSLQATKCNNEFSLLALLSHPALEHIHTLSLTQTSDYNAVQSRWIESFLTRSTYSHQQVVAEPISLVSLRNFTLNFDYFDTHEGNGIFCALGKFIISRTSGVRKAMIQNLHRTGGITRLDDGTRPVPPQLENICIYDNGGDWPGPLKMNDLRDLEKEYMNFCQKLRCKVGSSSRRAGVVFLPFLFSYHER